MKLYSAICCIVIAIAASSGVVGQDPTNLALEQLATQSSTGWNGPASLAVDGDKNDYYYAGSCSHTNNSVTTDIWWQVELKQDAEVYQIKIQNRDNHGSRLTDFDIFVGKTTDDLQSCAYFEGPGENGVEYTINCSQPLIGKYVKIDKRDDTQVLTLCEVEVIGWPVVADCPAAGEFFGYQNGSYRIYPCGADGGHVCANCKFAADGSCISE